MRVEQVGEERIGTAARCRVDAEVADEIDDFVDVGDDLGEAVPPGLVTAGRHHRGHWSRHHAHGSADLGGRASRVERTGPQRRLDDDHASRDGRDDSIAQEEPRSRRRQARSHLRDHRADLGDAGQEGGVGERIRAIEPPGENRDGGAVDRQGTAVGGGVDAERRPGHDGPAALGQSGAQTGCNGVAVGGTAPRSDHRHRALAQAGEIGVSEHPEAERRGRVVVHPLWPLRVARAEHRRVESPSGGQQCVRLRIDPEPLDPHTEHLRHRRITRPHEP